MMSTATIQSENIVNCWPIEAVHAILNISSNLEGHSTSGQNAPKTFGLELQLKIAM